MLLSIILVGKWDNYGEKIIKNKIYPLSRFKDRLKFSLKKNYQSFFNVFNNDFEFIIVDWCPQNNEYIHKNLSFKKKNIIFLPIEKNIIEKNPYLNANNVYEYIGKNAGIIRANGKNILITNPDIIFTQDMVKEIYALIISNKLDHNYIRPLKLINVKGNDVINLKNIDEIKKIPQYGQHISFSGSLAKLGTKASGDFILTTKKNFIKAEGFNEHMYKIRQCMGHHSDSNLLINMYLKGIKPICLKNNIYHIDHSRPCRNKWNYLLDNNKKGYINCKNWGFKSENIPFYYSK